MLCTVHSTVPGRARPDLGLVEPDQARPGLVGLSQTRLVCAQHRPSTGLYTDPDWVCTQTQSGLAEPDQARLGLAWLD